MFIRRPLFLSQLSNDVGGSLARLSGLDGFARATLVSVIPLVALKAFGSKDVIASVYFASTIFTLIFTINLAYLERLLTRRGLVTLGGLFLIVSVLLFSVGRPVLFALGIGLRSAGASMFSVCMSLYIMAYIGKKELAQNESRRMVLVGLAWLVAPSLGGWLYAEYRPVVVYTFTGIIAAAVIGYFWWLRLGHDEVIRAGTLRAENPLKSVRRYWAQPRLRLAYLIALSRACFWSALFVYGPIYVVEADLPVWLGGVLLSMASGLLLLSPAVRWLADRFGTRQVLMGCSVLVGGSLLALGLLGESQPLGILFWFVGSLGAATMDVLSNIPFMRLVRPRERTAMTMVFTTWRETSSLLTQALVFLTLLVAPFWVFYLLLAVLQLATAWGTSYLPRRI
ncbi:MAG: MFS transporter [Anaerolineales bacterium]|nr:MFS transporter [Anaerolineales bacterium]